MILCVENRRLHWEIAIRAGIREHPVSIVKIARCDLRVRKRLVGADKGIEGLLILAPANRTDKPVIVQSKALTAVGQAGIRKTFVTHVNLVDFGFRRISDY